LHFLFNFNDFVIIFNDLFGNIFQFLIICATLLLIVNLLLYFFTNQKDLKPVLTCIATVGICTLLNYLIFGRFPSLPPFLQFIEVWIKQLLGL